MQEKNNTILATKTKWSWKLLILPLLLFLAGISTYGKNVYAYSGTLVPAYINSTTGGILCSYYGGSIGSFTYENINMDGSETTLGSGGNNGCSSPSISPINVNIESGGIQISQGIHIQSNGYDVYAIWIPDGNGGYKDIGGSTETNIISTTPQNNTTIATSSSYTFNYTGYLNSDDLNSKSQVNWQIQNAQAYFPTCILGICSNGGTNLQQTLNLTTSGGFLDATTVSNLPTGTYWMKETILKGNYCLFGICTTTQNVYATTTTFIIGAPARSDAARILAGSATSTDFSECYITSLNLLTCADDIFTFAFIPTPDAIQFNIASLHDSVLTHFPIGYVTDFISIINSSTTDSIPVINATIPNGVVGAGTHIDLDISHSFDYILNATTSSFNNSSASSTQTFYQITSYYWEIFVWLGAIFYILGRLLGSHIIPSVHNTTPKKK